MLHRQNCVSKLGVDLEKCCQQMSGPTSIHMSWVQHTKIDHRLTWLQEGGWEWLKNTRRSCSDVIYIETNTVTEFQNSRIFHANFLIYMGFYLE